jgi:hypothetical protein
MIDGLATKKRVGKTRRNEGEKETSPSRTRRKPVIPSRGKMRWDTGKKMAKEFRESDEDWWRYEGKEEGEGGRREGKRVKGIGPAGRGGRRGRPHCWRVFNYVDDGESFDTW